MQRDSVRVSGRPHRGIQVLAQGGVTPNASNQHGAVPGPLEPDEFLAFDTRIRKLIDDLQKNPRI
jgi:hypothetical protein